MIVLQFRTDDGTTAAQIAEHAGLTKTTLFRHFADKREILFQGQEMLINRVMEAVKNAAEDNSPFEILRAAVLALCDAHTVDQRETGRRLEPILASSPELQERAAYKRSAITNALQNALATRLGDARRANVLADAGVRAYYDGFTSWTASDIDETLSFFVEEELVAYQMLLPAAPAAAGHSMR